MPCIPDIKFLIISSKPISKPYQCSLVFRSLISFALVLSLGGYIFILMNILFNITTCLQFEITKGRHALLFQSLQSLNDSIAITLNKSIFYAYDDFADNLLNTTTTLDCISIYGIKKVSFNKSTQEQMVAFPNSLHQHVQQDQRTDFKRFEYILEKEPIFICPTSGYISSSFGMRTDPIFEGAALHKGIDIANIEGTTVFCAADGVVQFSGRRPFWGNVITIQHFNSNYQTIYAHLHASTVKNRDTVNQGQVIGFMGNTGKSTGPHLHYEIRFLGDPVDPVGYLFPQDTVAD